MTERLLFHFSLSCIGEGNGNPLQCSCLESPRDRGAWWAAVSGAAQSRTRLKRLSSSRSSKGFPGGSEVKAFASNAGDPGSIPGSGSSPGRGNGNPLQYSCLENPMDRGAWKATVHGVVTSRTRLSDFTFTFTQTQRRQWHPTPVLLPGKSHGWRSLVGCSPWGR